MTTKYDYCIFSFKRRGVYLIVGLLKAAFISFVNSKKQDISETMRCETIEKM